MVACTTRLCRCLAITTEGLTMSETTLHTYDGTSLSDALKKADKAARNRALLLVTPLLLFLFITFIIPIAEMMWRSVYNPEIRNYLPQVSAEIKDWDGQSVPSEAVFAAMAADMTQGLKDRTIGRVAGRINREWGGARGLMMKTARKVKTMQPPYREAFIAQNKKWEDLTYWKVLQRETGWLTASYYLLAMDYQYNTEGEIVKRDEDYQVYQNLFWRTAWMSAMITMFCIILAYPVSYLLSILPNAKANLLMILVLLPFWTSLLVRTSAWIVLLQSEGVINDILVGTGIIDHENRPQMIYNATGTVIAMVHILLPFMILPLYSVMKTIPPSYLRAAKSLGAHPFVAWWRVYFPLTLPGMAAGVILVFILAIGYYITPALVGGQSGIFISNLIADNMQGTSAQLKLAAALATILLIATLIMYWAFNKLVGIDRLKFG